jgi:oligopeptidase B
VRKTEQSAGGVLPTPPVAPRRPVARTLHGETVTDDYAWLRDENWREVMRDPSKLNVEIRENLEAENRYTEAAFKPFDALKRELVGEMRGRIKEDDSSVPARDGPYSYYLRYRDGGQHPLLCRIPAEGGAEQLLLDGDVQARGLAYFQLGASRHSPDHKLFAWSFDDSGSEFCKICVRDLASGQDLADVVQDTPGSVVWTRDASAFFYVWRDAENRPSKVFLHKLGTKPEEDMLIYEEADKGMFVGIGELRAGIYGVITIGDHETTETRLIDLANPLAPPRVVAPRKTGERYEIEHHPSLNGQDTLLIITNANEAEDFKVMTVPLATPGREHWRDLIQHRPGTLIMDLSVLRDWIIRLERHEGLPRLIVRQLSDGNEHTIRFEEEAYALGMGGGYEFVTDELRFSYASMTTPTEVWDYNMRTKARMLKKRQEVPSGHDPSDYVTRRIFAPAADGETVPVSLLYRRETKLDGSAPCLLYGYGAYGNSMPASFSTNRLSLVDRGFVYAIAHVRGGTEKGWRWYREGKLGKKENTFTDFITAAKHLIREKFVSPEKIVAHGGSAGGLLMGAVAGPFCRDHRRGAVCRCGQHHARRDAAADPAGMAGMGEPDYGRGSLPPAAPLFAL